MTIREGDSGIEARLGYYVYMGFVWGLHEI